MAWRLASADLHRSEYRLEFAYVLNIRGKSMRTCDLMRSAVFSAAALLVSGVLIEILAQSTAAAVPASHVALLAVLASPLVMLAVFVVGLLPPRLTHLDECQH